MYRPFNDVQSKSVRLNRTPSTWTSESGLSEMNKPRWGMGDSTVLLTECEGEPEGSHKLTLRLFHPNESNLSASSVMQGTANCS